MNKVLAYTILILLGGKSFAQSNLVPNPSFEQYTQCPDAAGQVDRAVGWFATRNTPDYLHSCSGLPTSVPGMNTFGYQYPVTGNAYVGVYTSFSPEYREVVASQLSSPLVSGQKYYVSFKTCRGGGGLWNAQGATNNIGVLFSTKQYSISSPTPISNLAHIYVDSIITDSVNWLTVNGSFIADSAYQYINLGNFFDDANTDTMCLGWSCISGYFIDDICVSTDSLLCTYPIAVRNVNAPSLTIKLYPNPASHYLNVVFPYENNSNLIVYNSNGKVVLSLYDTANNLIINTSSLPQGLYFLKVISGINISTIKYSIIHN